MPDNAESGVPNQADVDALRDLLDLMADFPDNDQRARYLLTSNWMRDRQPISHGVAWQDRLNIICLCGKVCSGVIRKNPAGGFIGHPGSGTYVDPPAAQVFANHLWEMNHPSTSPGLPLRRYHWWTLGGDTGLDPHGTDVCGLCVHRHNRVEHAAEKVEEGRQ